MSNTKHTPGPWSVDVNDHQGFIRGSQPIVRNCEEGDNGMTISGLMVTGCGSYVEGFPQLSHEDARLIAAAPELLAALQSVVEWMDAPDESGFSDNQLSAARSAIAKATQP